MIEKRGKVTHITFHSQATGYTVLVFETEGERFNAVGNMPLASTGAPYVLRGDFVVNPKYGEQFAFTEYEEILPSSVNGIIGFLSSGAVKGVGPETARAIVEMFGEDTFRVIEEAPDELKKVKGIGKKRAEEISKSFAEHRGFAEVSIFFQSYGIGAREAMRIYEIYGGETIDAVKENPYILSEEIFGIGFLRADDMAIRMGIDSEDESRLKSGVLYVLGRYISEGHTFLPREMLAEEAGNMLEVPSEIVDDQLISMDFEGSIVIDELEGLEIVYRYDYYVAERNVAIGLSLLEKAHPAPIDTDTDRLISLAEERSKIAYSDNQKNAIRACLENSVCVITGGPGTGKTTITGAIIDIMESGGIQMAIAAPTGRAAKRITEATGHEASTIHRLLEYSYGEDEMVFGRDEGNPLDVGAVIIDEVSMVDLMLMDALIRAIKPETRLILIGDADQLPSVGAGNVLRDIIASEFVFVTQLSEIFRQSGESRIAVNAHLIKQGEHPSLNEEGGDFFMVRRNREEEMAETIVELCEKRLPAHYSDLDPLNDIQVLTPVRKGNVGVAKLNERLQMVLNPPDEGKREKKIYGKTFREGDKVMQIKNNYGIHWRKPESFIEGDGIFNGDFGFVENIDSETESMRIIFDEEKLVIYDFADLDQLEIAYAVTVHKSQGSEFPVVVMPMSYFPPMLATRNLLYTAVTRGKRAVVLVGSEAKLDAMVDNNRITARYSGLAARLKGLMGMKI